MRSNGLSSHHKTTQPCRAGGMVKKQNFLFVGRLDDRGYALRTRCELQLAGPTLGADLKCRNFELSLRKQKFRESTTDSNPITNHQDPITIPEHRVSRDYNHTTNPDHRIRQNNRRSLKPPHPGAPPSRVPDPEDLSGTQGPTQRASAQLRTRDLVGTVKRDARRSVQLSTYRCPNSAQYFRDSTLRSHYTGTRYRDSNTYHWVQ